MKKIVIIDGQGGGVGKNIVERLAAANLPAEIIVVGTNAIATSNMMKAGAKIGATGESACIYNCEVADILVGPFGLIIPNALHGEISAPMANAVAKSSAEKVLILLPHQHGHLIGMEEKPLSVLIDDAVKTIKELCEA